MPTLGSVLAFLLLGALAGWLAGLLMRGHGLGLIANIFVGILGALIGGLLFDWADWDVGGGFLAELFVAFVGAAVLLFVTGVLGRLSGRRR